MAKSTKSATKRTVKKTPAKKGTKKTPAKKKTVAKASVNGKLRKPQIRILKALKSGRALTRKQISEQAPCDLAMLNSYIGAHDDTVRAKNDKKVMVSLRTLKYIKVEQHDIDGRDTVVHTITALGKKATG